MHQPTTSILNMLDQVYILARGGVCIYAGAPSQIRESLHQLPELRQTECKYPIELLLEFSCKGSQNATVQSLAQINAQCFESKVETLLLESTQPMEQMPMFNRTRFSFHSISVLFQ